MTSTINCYRGEVKIYDSVYIIPYAEGHQIVKNIFTQPESFRQNAEAAAERSC